MTPQLLTKNHAAPRPTVRPKSPVEPSLSRTVTPYLSPPATPPPEPEQEVKPSTQIPPVENIPSKTEKLEEENSSSTLTGCRLPRRRFCLIIVLTAGSGIGTVLLDRFRGSEKKPKPTYRTKGEFKVVTVNAQGKEIESQLHQAEYLSEDLGNGVSLELVRIPSGSFQMGSPRTEAWRDEDESPQHQVTMTSFWMGKYPVTQDQWKAVASLPKVNRNLYPYPSYHKGAKLPVESISWYRAVEFCERLSQKTGREYRLPSEAEWEYACRAGTTTPFHFGETITTDLANYNGNYTYGLGPKGTYRQQTTEVGSFQVANAFGLYDMHGNVWEWCADHRHHSYYEGAPTDGSAWVTGGDDSHRVVRGGAWNMVPWYCRSADRGWVGLDPLTNTGFRVACSAT